MRAFMIAVGLALTACDSVDDPANPDAGSGGSAGTAVLRQIDDEHAQVEPCRSMFQP